MYISRALPKLLGSRTCCWCTPFCPQCTAAHSLTYASCTGQKWRLGTLAESDARAAAHKFLKRTAELLYTTPGHLEPATVTRYCPGEYQRKHIDARSHADSGGSAAFLQVGELRWPILEVWTVPAACCCSTHANEFMRSCLHFSDHCHMQAISVSGAKATACFNRWPCDLHVRTSRDLAGQKLHFKQTGMCCLHP